MKKNTHKPTSRTNELVTLKVGKEILIYDLRNNRAFCLNEACAAVWNLCDGSRSIEEIERFLEARKGKKIGPELVWLALEQLLENKLLERRVSFEAPVHGLSRREVIRKIGFTSSVAIPIVSCLVAPLPTMAQSTVCAASPCRCPNSASSCNGSTSGPFVNCFTFSMGIANCNCIGPFDPPDSAGSGFKSSQTGCTLE